MPPKWVVYGPCASWPPDSAWYYVMGNVSRARFYVGDPGVSYDSQIWDIGFDNARIALGKFGSGPSQVSDGRAVPMTVAPDPND